MASTYKRKDSPFIWIRYKDERGKWKNKSSGYRANNGWNIRQAEILAKEQTRVEEAREPIRSGQAPFQDWVTQWIDQKWGSKEITAKIYHRRWQNVMTYLKERDATTPVAVTREVVLAYPQWRQAGRNTAIYELTFLASVLDEAIERKFITSNCARKLKLNQAEHVHAEIWTDMQIEVVLQEVEKVEKYGWMHVAFLMGKFQAARLGQCAVPINCINLKRGMIQYPSSIMKGGKSFTQMIDPVFLPILTEIVEHRKKLGYSTICDIPTLRGVEIRKFLDSLGKEFKNISHHGLRVYWVTNAARQGMPESVARRFVNHASSLVHQIYQRIEAEDIAPWFGKLHQPLIE